MVKELPDIDSLLRRYAEFVTGETSYESVELVKTAAIYSFIAKNIPSLAHEWVTEECNRDREMNDIMDEMDKFATGNTEEEHYLHDSANEEHRSPIDPLTLPYDLKLKAFYSTLLRLKNMYGIQTNDGIRITKYFTGKELAKMTGTTTFFIVREIKNLKDIGIIVNEGGIMTIRDVEYLQKIAQCRKCPADLCRF